MEEWFNFFDKGGDGAITEAEFEKTMSELGFHLAPDEVRVLIDRFQVRVDRRIDWAAFLQFVDRGNLKTPRRPIEELAVEVRRAIRSHSAATAQSAITSLRMFGRDLEANRQTFRSLGVELSIEEVSRLAHVFGQRLDLFFAFTSSGGDDAVELDSLERSLLEALNRRCGSSDSKKRRSDSGSITKLWSTLAPGGQMSMPEDTFVQGLERMLEDDSALALESWSGLPFCVTVRMLLDRTVWVDESREELTAVTYNDLALFIRYRHLLSVERKLRTILKQPEAVDGTVWHMVRIFADPETQQALVVTAAEPLSGQAYSVRLDEPPLPGAPLVISNEASTHEPVGRRESARSGGTAPPGFGPVYNAECHPEQDATLLSIMHRLRLTTRGQKTKLALGEREPFVEHLRNWFHKANLPFFVAVSDLWLSFQVDAKTALRHGGLHKAVFRSLGREPALSAFLKTTLSTLLQVSISSFDGDEHHVLSWTEFVAFISGYRNPKFTLELLPCGTAGRTTFYAGTPDSWGGSHPKWLQDFVFDFAPPGRLPALFTEIWMKREHGRNRYLVVSVHRQGERVFATAYDPKTSSEFMCKFVTEAGFADWVTRAGGAAGGHELDTLRKQLSEAMSSRVLELSEMLTPRLIIKAYNDGELLGSSEVSISAVLSNCGQLKQGWATLLHGDDRNPAGQVCVELKFQRDTKAAQKGQKPRVAAPPPSQGEQTHEMGEGLPALPQPAPQEPAAPAPPPAQRRSMTPIPADHDHDFHAEEDVSGEDAAVTMREPELEPFEEYADESSAVEGAGNGAMDSAADASDEAQQAAERELELDREAANDAVQQPFAAAAADSDLPEGWSSGYDKKRGRTYYLDHSNRRTTWLHPITGKAAPKQKSSRR